MEPFTTHEIANLGDLEIIVRVWDDQGRFKVLNVIAATPQIDGKLRLDIDGEGNRVEKA